MIRTKYSTARAIPAEIDRQVETRKRNLRLIKAAEKRLEHKPKRQLSNADQVRYLAVIALRTAKKPLTLDALATAFNQVLKFRMRSEFLLMDLLMKRTQTGIVLIAGDHGITFGLKEWEQR